VLREVCPDREDLPRLLSELTRRGILHEGCGAEGVVFRFDHPLTRDVVYGNILRGRRREYHRIAAEALEKLHEERTGPVLDLLAFHWAESDRPDRALDALSAAAAHNAHRGEPEAALAQYTQAIDLARQDRERLFRLLLGRSVQLARAGRQEEALRDAEDALELAAGQEELSRTRINLAGALRACGRFDEAAREFETASRLAGGDLEIRARALLGQANVANLRGHHTDALRLLKEAGGLVETLGDSHLTATYHAELAPALYDQGDIDGAAAEAEKARAICVETGDRAGAVTCLAMIATMLISAGRYDEAVEKLTATASQARAVGRPIIRADALYGLAYLHIQRGDLQAARETHRELEECAAELGRAVNIAHALRLRGVLALLGGDYDRALRDLKEARRQRKEIGDRRDMHDCDLHLAQLHLECGQAEQALARAESVEHAARERDDPFQQCEAETMRAAALLAMGERETAAAASERALKMARRFEEPEDLIPALIVRAATGDGDDALKAVTEAVDRARECGRRLDEAHALLQRGRMLFANGKADGAADDGRRAAAIGKEAGVPELAWRGNDLLAEASAAQGESEAAGAARDEARAAVVRIAHGIEDPDLARGYREDAGRAALLARPTHKERRPGPPRMQRNKEERDVR